MDSDRTELRGSIDPSQLRIRLARLGRSIRLAEPARLASLIWIRIGLIWPGFAWPDSLAWLAWSIRLAWIGPGSGPGLIRLASDSACLGSPA
ncbi:MAG: hypothetical protein HS111_28595 [Kofleriaceae bacterium]|nr:hypothetical protein [Kofleriaceae bacterium]